MRKLFILPALLATSGAMAIPALQRGAALPASAYVQAVQTETTTEIVKSNELETALTNARNACGGISDSLNHLKTMAGINTGITAVGAAAGGVAWGTGIAKNKNDNSIKDFLASLEKQRTENGDQPTEAADLPTKEELAEGIKQAREEALAKLKDKNSEHGKEYQKSKTLGNIRTGALAVATATNIAGASIAGANQVDKDLSAKISNCIANVKILSTIYMQERMDKTADPMQLEKAQNILAKCGNWEYVDLSAINKRATKTAVASGIGAGTGLAGTITSALGNKGDFDKKEQKLNTAANTMAGVTTVASGVATVFNATQINAIKRAVEVADNCEGVL